MNCVGKFEKVSFGQYLKDMEPSGLSEAEIREVYDNIKLPRRATAGSAGYDFFAPYSFTLSSGDSIKIPTGIRVKIEDGWFLACVPRSGLGFKYRFQLDNTIGIVDLDYYNSDNEGHIFVKATMDHRDRGAASAADLFSAFFDSSIVSKLRPTTMTVEQGGAFVQGIFLPYGLTVDDDTDGIRNGGFGSTDKEGAHE